MKAIVYFAISLGLLVTMLRPVDGLVLAYGGCYAGEYIDKKKLRTCANRFLVPENPCIEQVVSSVTTNGSTSIQLFKGGAICYVSNQTTNLFGKLLDNHQMKQ